MVAAGASALGGPPGARPSVPGDSSAESDPAERQALRQKWFADLFGVLGYSLTPEIVELEDGTSASPCRPNHPRQRPAGALDARIAGRRLERCG